MLPEITQLLILQDKDQTLKRLQTELKRLPMEEERAKQKLASDTEAVKVAKHTMQENEVAMKNLELQIDTRKQTISRLKVQQFETRKNDEYAALGNEVVRYTAEISGLEDQEMELMEKAELLKSALAKAQEGLAASQKHVDAELGQITERIKNLDVQVKEVQTARDGLAAKVDEDLLEMYGRIWKSRGDSAVVAIAGNICRGCNMKVAPAVLMGVKGDKVLTNCSNCGRLVYLGDS
jgi:predicted  nucleic acid-binding Zn-ribbon protein